MGRRKPGSAMPHLRRVTPATCAGGLLMSRLSRRQRVMTASVMVVMKNRVKKMMEAMMAALARRSPQIFFSGISGRFLDP